MPTGDESDRRFGLDDVVDTDRYPIADPEARAQIITRCRTQLEQESCVVLPGFVTRDVAAKMAAEGRDALPLAHRRENQLTAYADSPVADEVPADHPARRVSPFRQHVIANDLLPADGRIIGFYHQDEVVALIRDILGEPTLNRAEDPLLSCTVTAMADGDEHGWHFDSNDFVVSLLLQSPEDGGVFEFAPFVRGENQENFEEVGKVMSETSALSRSKSVETGTLMIFCGRRSLHRVSPVVGNQSRLIALFCYDRRPGMQFSDSARTRAVGRTTVRPDTR